METQKLTTKDVKRYLNGLNPVTLDETQRMLNQLDRMWQWEIAGKGRYSVLKLIDRKSNELYRRAAKLVQHG
jgi:hypothetical protein